MTTDLVTQNPLPYDREVMETPNGKRTPRKTRIQTYWLDFPIAARPYQDKRWRRRRVHVGTLTCYQFDSNLPKAGPVVDEIWLVGEAAALRIIGSTALIYE